MAFNGCSACRRMNGSGLIKAPRWGLTLLHHMAVVDTLTLFRNILYTQIREAQFLHRMAAGAQCPRSVPSDGQVLGCVWLTSPLTPLQTLTRPRRLPHSPRMACGFEPSSAAEKWSAERITLEGPARSYVARGPVIQGRALEGSPGPPRERPSRV